MTQRSARAFLTAGKVFSREDLDFIARLCVENDTYVISGALLAHER